MLQMSNVLFKPSHINKLAEIFLSPTSLHEPPKFSHHVIQTILFEKTLSTSPC